MCMYTVIVVGGVYVSHDVFVKDFGMYLERSLGVPNLKLHNII